MTINVGDSIPFVRLATMGAEGKEDLSTDDLFKGKKVVIFGLPGAFTPTCSEKHLPGYIELYEAFEAVGVDAIACIAVNDAHVMLAWAEQLGANGLIDLFADSRYMFSDALGLTTDMGPVLGIRAARSALIVNDGIITHFFKEKPKAFEVSDAKSLLSVVSH